MKANLKTMISKPKVPPRQTPDRDSKYMGLACMMASFSKDPSTQVGSIIINHDNTPLSWGYNGPPASTPDDSFSWERPEKYQHIIHAEENAIKHSFLDLINATMYVSAFPCKRCMNLIAEKQVKRIVYLEREYDSRSMQMQKEDVEESWNIAHKNKLVVEKFAGDVGWLNSWVKELDLIGVFKSINSI